MHVPTALAMMASISITAPIVAWLAVGAPRQGGGVYWFLATLCGGIGISIVLGRSYFPSLNSFLADQITNFGVFLALLLRWRAMEEQVGKPCPWSRVLIELGAFGGILSMLYLLDLDIARSVFLSFLYAFVAWQLFMASRLLYREMPTLAVGLCVFFSFMLMLSFTGIAFLSLQGNSFRAIGPGVMTSAVALIAFGASVLTNFVWVGVVSFRANERREQQLLEYERHERQAHISRELARVEAKNSIEVMSTGLAHELGQPLAAMLTTAQLCRRMVADGLVDTRSAAVLLENILAGVSRATAIIEKTRITHSKLLGRDGFCNVPETIEQSVALGVAEAEKVHAQVSVKHTAAVLSARIDPVHLSQVLANILRNAIQAVANSPIRQVFVTAEPAGEWVRITITDTGPGIPAAMQDKVGSLFFTTRQEGLGMGLAVSREILAKYGGTLNLQNADSAGLRVVVEVPSHGA